MSTLDQLLEFVDPQLKEKFQKTDIQLSHFALRWLLCVLSRELDLPIVQRFWDVELCISFSFHYYICISLMIHWRKNLLSSNFEQIVHFLQNLPTRDFTNLDVETILFESSLIMLVDVTSKFLLFLSGLYVLFILLFSLVLTIPGFWLQEKSQK